MQAGLLSCCEGVVEAAQWVSRCVFWRGSWGRRVLSPETPIESNVVAARRARREWLWPVVMALTITWCSGRGAVSIESDWIQFDKLAHFAIYGALATTIARWARWRERRWRGAVWATVIATAYGLGDEFRQTFSGVRVFDLKDWAADAAGAVVAAGLYAGWPAYRRLMEMPLRRAKRHVQVSTDSSPNFPA